MEFPIVPAEGLWWLYGVFAAASAAMAFGFGRLQRQARAGSTSLALKARYALPLGAVAMIVAGWTVHEQASATIEVGQGRVQIHAGFYSQDLQISDFRLRDAELVDLRESRHLQPTSRTNGTGAPGLRAGWFVLRNRERAFLLVTDPGAVVYVPGRAFSVLASLQDPEGFLEALGSY